jgi:histidyl-tRNA synthetase
MKAKPKFQPQFKAAEANGVPFAILLGDDEVAAGKVKIKELGLQEGHPEKEGVLISQEDMAKEIKVRLQRKRELDAMTTQAEGLRVVHGIKGDAVKDAEKKEEDTKPDTTPAAAEPTPETEEQGPANPAA